MLLLSFLVIAPAAVFMAMCLYLADAMMEARK